MSGKTGETVERYTIMMAGNLFIGICVGAYRLSAFGVDAFTCMNLGLSQFVGMSFGTWQLLVNVFILGLVFWKARGRIGPGTVVNMVGVGYLADFLCWLFLDVWQVEMTLPLRVAALMAGSVLSALGVALYITPELGTAPYDSLGLIVEDAAGGRVSFRSARVAIDVTAVVTGVVFCLLAGGELRLILGVGTVCNALFNGPLIQFFRTRVAEPVMNQH